MSDSARHSIHRIAELCREYLASVVDVEYYEFAPCYLWYDRPLYDCFGEPIRQLRGDTIYLHEQSSTPARDLFHELGHVVGRKCNQVGHSENGYRGDWEQQNARLIGLVSERRHWSGYLNLLPLNHGDFKTNAASEVWAELFMLWHLHPESAEARLLDNAMARLAQTPVCAAIAGLARELHLPFADDRKGREAG
ncbi:MAG: hypothetical protein QNJ85_13270 [Gammaproteobacteria bacterium]|nr:hypothetical protein [Gammaproteobacteria bacterium]